MAVAPPARFASSDLQTEGPSTVGGRLADHLEDFGQKVAGTGQSDGQLRHLVGDFVAEVVAALEGTVLAVGHLAPRDGDPLVVLVRTLGRIAELTAGHDVALPAARVEALLDLCRRADHVTSDGHERRGSRGARSGAMRTTLTNGEAVLDGQRPRAVRQVG